MSALVKVVTAEAIVIAVLSQQVPDPKEIIAFAEANGAIFKKSPDRKSQYVMLQRPWDAEPHTWGVETMLCRGGRKLLDSRS